MSEDRPSNRPPNGPPNGPPDDARDERLASLLDVPPLDDVTRRRLVRRALDEPGALPQRRRLAGILGIAAAALLLVVGAAVVLRDDGGDTTVAGRERDDKTAEPAAGGADESAAAAAPTYVGDIGEVSDPVVLRQRLAELAAAPQSAESFVDFSCVMPKQLGTSGPFTLSADGTYEGSPVSVLVASKAGIDIAFVIDAASCELRSEVPLG